MKPRVRIARHLEPLQRRLLKRCRRYNLCPFRGGPGCIFSFVGGTKTSTWECVSFPLAGLQSVTAHQSWRRSLTLMDPDGPREGRAEYKSLPPALLGPVNDVRLFSPGPLTFWQPPANSILPCRSRRTMWLWNCLNEVLPPTVWLFSRSLGTSFWAHCPSL